VVGSKKLVVEGLRTGKSAVVIINWLMLPTTDNGQLTANKMKIAEIKPVITIQELERIDVRVGTIVSVEDLPGSDKLVRLIVNFGDHTRRILAGIKQERSNPRELEGKQALFVVNLEPKKMMGEVSEGMLFDIGFSDGLLPRLAIPEQPVPNGSRAG
jgi:tRNA-binding protein